MFRFSSEPTSVNFTVDKGVMTSYVNNLGCPSSVTEQLFPLTTADSSLERKEVLSGKYNFEQQLETGASMVDKKFGDFQWDHDDDKCINPPVMMSPGLIWAI